MLWKFCHGLFSLIYLYLPFVTGFPSTWFCKATTVVDLFFYWRRCSRLVPFARCYLCLFSWDHYCWFFVIYGYCCKVFGDSLGIFLLNLILVHGMLGIWAKFLYFQAYASYEESKSFDIRTIWLWMKSSCNIFWSNIIFYDSQKRRKMNLHGPLHNPYRGDVVMSLIRLVK